MIKIIKNNELEISKIKMKCDPKLPHGVKEPLQDAGFLYLLSAPPASGKTNLLINLLSNKTMYRGKFDKIYWFSPSAHTVEVPIPEEQVIQGYSADIINDIIEDINNNDDMQTKNILFVFDDCVSKLKKNDLTLSELAFNRRHKIKNGSLSLIFTTQMLNSIPTTLRRNSTALFIFRTNSENERDIIIKEFLNLPHEVSLQILKLVFRKPHAFLYINNNTQDYNNKYYSNFDKIEIELDN